MNAEKQVEKFDQNSMVEKLVVQGDLSALTPQERFAYYNQVCESMGLNPLTKPFEYIKLNNKLTLYAKRDATDQLRSLRGISIEITSREMVGDLYIVTARATEKIAGRTDESVGAVSLANLKGEAAANAIMKAETKAKRRVTLSIVGLGFLDETEISSIPNALPVTVDTSTGEIIGNPQNVTKITPDPIEENKVFTAVVWIKEMIDADQIEENWEKVQRGYAKLSSNERMAVDAQLKDKAPNSNKSYRNLLKEYLDFKLINPSYYPLS